jgi:hypothetical protein
VCISEKEITSIFGLFLRPARESAMTLQGKFKLLTAIFFMTKKFRALFFYGDEPLFQTKKKRVEINGS